MHMLSGRFTCANVEAAGCALLLFLIHFAVEVAAQRLALGLRRALLLRVVPRCAILLESTRASSLAWDPFPSCTTWHDMVCPEARETPCVAIADLDCLISTCRVGRCDTEIEEEVKMDLLRARVPLRHGQKALRDWRPTNTWVTIQ